MEFVNSSLATCSKIRENLQAQLFELEAIESMFCNPGEVRIEDPTVLADIQAYVADDTIELLPSYLDVTINLHIDTTKFELCINLSQDYPNIEPDIFVRNHKLNKHQHHNLNRALNDFVASLNRGEPCIFSAISWLQDNAANYLDSGQQEQRHDNGAEKIDKNETLVRYWIYSHHIYSKTKRREIVDLANQLNITGFCMPGRPGIVCVEGTTSDCNEWWQAIKAMNWKRIFCKITEECKKGDDNDRFLKFGKFEEVIFYHNNLKCIHMDMGELLKFLENHSCGNIFKELFGVDAKNGSST